jgi:hypothetical protein
MWDFIPVKTVLTVYEIKQTLENDCQSSELFTDKTAMSYNEDNLHSLAENKY